MPSTEFSASLLTTSADGRLARVTDTTSSSRRGGATFVCRRLESRSMTRVSATTEQKIKGQIGHPAACMIENTSVLSALWRGKTGLASGAIMACSGGSHGAVR
ncbi:MAG: hypothetical protein V9G29_02670 [Burkholderiaceae bacterium]